MIENFKSIIALSKYENFTDAAEFLYISQSALTKRIKKIEDKLGTEIYDRNLKEVTRTGEIVLNTAITIENVYKNMLTELDKYKSEYTVKMGVLPVLNDFNISQTISSYFLKYKDVEISIDELSQDDILVKFKNDLLDLAIIRSEEKNLLRYDHVLIGTEKLVMVCNKNYKFADKNYIDIEDLENEPLILYDRSSNLNTTIRKAFSQKDIQVNVVNETSRLEVITAMIFDGHGISLLTDNNLKYIKENNLVVIEPSRPIYSKIYLIKDKNQNNIKVNSVFNHFKETYRLQEHLSY